MEIVDIIEIEAVTEEQGFTLVHYRDGRLLRLDEPVLKVMEFIAAMTGKSIYLLMKNVRQLGALRLWEKPGLLCLAPMVFFVPVPMCGRKIGFVNLARAVSVTWRVDAPVVHLQSGHELKVLWNLSQFGKRWKNALDVRERYLSLCRHQLALADILHA